MGRAAARRCGSRRSRDIHAASATLTPSAVCIGTRTVSALTLPATQTPGRTPFSDDGRLLIHLTFSDGSSALYHYTLQ